MDGRAVLRRDQAFGHPLSSDDGPEHAADLPRAGRQDLARAAEGGQGVRIRARGLGARRLPGRRAAQR
ncbi:hypothetical protein G6F63_016987 [Rhizopus arrhizus]|nr:hypothetical protein G6F65_023154 [Rhizopus arrhizus]KAG1291064.1 hypothetical protein G6F63_016987 [Rhizopus arrhizus]